MDDPFRPSKRRRWTKAVVALVALVAAYFGIQYATKVYRIRHSATALASVRKCLFGAPLEREEHPSGRLHRIVLGNPPKDWPARCAKYVQDFEEVDEVLHGIDVTAPRAVIDLDEVQRTPYGFDAYFEVRTKRGTAPDDVPLAPPFVDVADDRTPALVPNGSLIGATFDPMPGANLDFVVGGTTICRSPAGLKKLACSLGAVQPKASLWPGSADGGPLLVAPFLEGWFGSGDPLRKLGDSRSLCAGANRACTAFGESDGSVLVLSRTSTKPGVDYDFWYAVSRDAGPLVDAKWTTSASADVTLVGDRAVWTEPDAHMHDHLFVKRFSGTTPSETEAIGEVASGPFDACFLRDGVAVYGSTWMTVLHDGAHSPVHSFAALNPNGSSSVFGAVSCGDDAVTFTSVDGFVVHVVRCADGGCAPDAAVDLRKTFAAFPEARRPSPTDVRAVGLGDALVVVWRSARGGFRARVAKPEAIAAATDHVVYDDTLQEGTAATMSFVQNDYVLVARRDAAVLLLETLGRNAGIKALRIGRDGTVGAL